ncbi:TPA: hypothetical protein HA253_01330, partial [Candidatus Woesearchaeota archaeon]|nr:hypothetical protein [Candidatus Woesearchaeota archaeon]
LSNTALNFSNFTAQDTTAPVSLFVAPVAQTTKEANTSIGVSINTTEVVNISVGYVNVTRPNISNIYRVNLTLGQLTGDRRNMSTSYLVQRTLGRYNLTFFVNDTSGNVLSTATLNFSNFTVADTVAPVILYRVPAPQSTAEINATLRASINLTEVVNVSVGYVNVSRSNISTIYRINLSLGQSAGDRRNMSGSYLIHRTPGRFNFTFFVNDTSGNIISSTTLNFTNITAQDTTAPTANKRGPAPQSSFEANASLVLSFNVTELSNLSTVYANITRPNISTVYRLNMSTLSKETPAERNQTGTYIIQRTTGKYNVTFYAADSGNNLLSSTTLNFTNFTVTDTAAPGIIARGPTPQSSKEINASLMVSWNLTEVVNISVAYVNITRPNISTVYRLNVTL